jgi:hypothetical protein
MSTNNMNYINNNTIQKDKFTDYITNISDLLGLENQEKDNLINQFRSLTNQEQIEIMTNIKLKELVDKLLDADKEFTKLVTEDGKLKEYYSNNNNKKKWDSMMFQFGKLQGLILLKKISQTKQCNEKINLLVDALTNKLTYVNNILTENLNDQTTPTPTINTTTKTSSGNNSGQDQSEEEEYNTDSNDINLGNKKYYNSDSLDYHKKYLKYKNKYLSIKNKFI